MEFLYVHMPISGVEIFWPGLIILGVSVGVLGGFFGMGAAWMITPGLNILGFPMAFAIGTDIAHMAGKSIIATMRHGKFGNVDYKLGLTMIIGTIVGFEIGAQMIMWFERIGKVDLYVRILYIILLAFITWMVVHDVRKAMAADKAAKAAGKKIDKMAAGITWYKTLHKIKIPPVIHFKQGGFTCSAWLPIFVSFITGWLAGILGIGGGLIRMPSLIYFVGCPTHVAVGTDLFEVMISGIYGTATYTYKGRTELLGALIMLCGAAVGAQFGAVATKYVKGYGIRIAFGICVFGCMVSIIEKLLAREYNIPLLDTLSTVTILSLTAGVGGYIIVKMLAGARKEISMKKAKAAAEGGIG